MTVSDPLEGQGFSYDCGGDIDMCPTGGCRICIEDVIIVLTDDDADYLETLLYHTPGGHGHLTDAVREARAAARGRHAK